MKINKKQYILIAIAALMILTNPSRSEFGSHLHQTGLGDMGRDFNAILFSIYSKEILIYDGTYDGNKSPIRVNNKIYYLGLLGNFIEINSEKNKAERYKSETIMEEMSKPDSVEADIVDTLKVQ